MGALQRFLNANPVDNLTTEVAISDRFKDDEGNLLKFKIRAITAAEFESLRQKALTIKRGGKDFHFDTGKFNMALVINCTVEPNFKDAESIKALGCATPEQYLNRVLLAGEVEELARQIQKFSGFDTNMEELVQEAKN